MFEHFLATKRTLIMGQLGLVPIQCSDVLTQY